MKTEIRLLALALMLFVLIVASCRNQAVAGELNIETARERAVVDQPARRGAVVICKTVEDAESNAYAGSLLPAKSAVTPLDACEHHLV